MFFSFFAANSFSGKVFFLGRGCCFDLVWQSGARVIWTILSTARLRGGTVRCAGRPWPLDCVHWRLVGGCCSKNGEDVEDVEDEEDGKDGKDVEAQKQRVKQGQRRKHHKKIDRANTKTNTKKDRSLPSTKSR